MHADDPLPHFSRRTPDDARVGPTGWVQHLQLRSRWPRRSTRPCILSPDRERSAARCRKAGVEVRIGDGLNYYFEYRIGQAAADRRPDAADRQPRARHRRRLAPLYAPFPEPGILLLTNDIDGDGAVLGNRQDLRGDRHDDPVYPRIQSRCQRHRRHARPTCESATASTANPTRRSGRGRRRRAAVAVPDIEVRNARNAADAAWFNVPWVGNTNTVVAE